MSICNHYNLFSCRLAISSISQLFQIAIPPPSSALLASATNKHPQSRPMAQPLSDTSSASTAGLIAQFDQFTAAFHSLVHNIQSRIAQIDQRDKQWADTQAKVQADAQKVDKRTSHSIINTALLAQLTSHHRPPRLSPSTCKDNSLPHLAPRYCSTKAATFTPCYLAVCALLHTQTSHEPLQNAKLADQIRIKR